MFMPVRTKTTTIIEFTTIEVSNRMRIQAYFSIKALHVVISNPLIFGDSIWNPLFINNMALDILKIKANLPIAMNKTHKTNKIKNLNLS